MALTLWKRVLYCIKRLLEVLCEHLGVTIDELEESLINEFDIEENDYLPITLQSSIVRLSSEKLIPTNTFPRLSSAKAAAYFLFSI